MVRGVKSTLTILGAKSKVGNIYKNPHETPKNFLTSHQVSLMALSTNMKGVIMKKQLVSRIH